VWDLLLRAKHLFVAAIDCCPLRLASRRPLNIWIGSLLDIDERTMRKYVAGDLVIPEMLVWALRGLAQRDPDEDANSAT
jgi:hypothetical protein